MSRTDTAWTNGIGRCWNAVDERMPSSKKSWKKSRWANSSWFTPAKILVCKGTILQNVWSGWCIVEWDSVSKTQVLHGLVLKWEMQWKKWDAIEKWQNDDFQIFLNCLHSCVLRQRAGITTVSRNACMGSHSNMGTLFRYIAANCGYPKVLSSERGLPNWSNDPYLAAAVPHLQWKIHPCQPEENQLSWQGEIQSLSSGIWWQISSV